MSLKLKRYLIVFIAVVTLGAPLLIPATSFADTPTAPGGPGGPGGTNESSETNSECNNIQGELNAGAETAVTGHSASSGCTYSTGKSTVSTGIKNIAIQAVNIISIIVGVVAIIMIIYGGFKYITSGGESNNVSAAKNTLIYAIIGLIVVALAQVIVHWVLDTSSNIATPAFIRIIFP